MWAMYNREVPAEIKRKYRIQNSGKIQNTMWAMYNREVPAEIKGPGTTLPPLHHLATTSSSVQQKYKFTESNNKNTNTQKIKKVTRKTKKRIQMKV